ncbi:CAP domain-containing protein [Neobacillus cucumis]|uniref:Serine protease n=1 Tax=Neobacillus cucumis TaxID=1740721 RepID=A0A2N5HSP4_9BACI|nr:CAP domain-containing protein [Neobacillus cucumis]PLS08541.1 serine protease [Neobacillus cucumis]
MFRLLMIIIAIFFIHSSWPFFEKQLEHTDLSKGISEVSTWKDSLEVKTTIQNIYSEIQTSLQQLGLLLDEFKQNDKPLESKNESKVQLTTPEQQEYSISNIELGDNRDDIIENLGVPIRSTINEYGTNWDTYHDHYHNFFMVMYGEDHKVAGLYTNQDLIASKNGIKLGTPKDTVRNLLGKPLTTIQKGLILYKLSDKEDYDVFLLDNDYITFFYDKHQGNTVTAVQLISKEMEDKKIDIYTKPSSQLKEGFEFQLFDLTNAARIQHQLPALTWDEHVQVTARKHSTDMAVNNYFNHTNLKGQSPFDRMKQDDIVFHLAGENLAYGQFSSIFAHEGLMNSLGHRENILRQGYKYLGVGVAFNNESQPYYTENFYAK